MRERVVALGKDVRAHAGFVVEESAFVWIRRWRVHARAQVYEHPGLAFAALDDGSRSVGAEPRRVHKVVVFEDAHGGRPLERGKCLIEWTAHRVVVGDKTGRLAGALKEMRQGIGAIVERADDA